MKRLTVSLAAVLLALVWSIPAHAATAQIGKAAPDFDLEGTDGKHHKLSDYKGKIVVIQWQGCKCPWDRGYRPVLNSIYNQFHMVNKDGKPTEQVVFLGINSNAEDSIDQIKAVQKQFDIPFVILKDPHNKVADIYEAKTTPHMFVIDRDGVLRYRGGIEKAPLDPEGIGQSNPQYLQPVLAALVDGKDLPYTETVSKGCGIHREPK